MFKVGVKIDAWPFWTYIWEGEGYSHLFLCRPTPRPMRVPMSTHASTHARVYAHLFDFFVNFENSWKIYKNLWTEQMKKVRLLIGIWCIPRFRCNFSLPTSKKAKTKRFYTPPLGVKKRQSLFPPKRIFWQEQISFYVQSRSQNRCLTILCAK